MDRITRFRLSADAVGVRLIAQLIRALREPGAVLDLPATERDGMRGRRDQICLALLATRPVFDARLLKALHSLRQDVEANGRPRLAVGDDRLPELELAMQAAEERRVAIAVGDLPAATATHQFDVR